VIEKNEFNDTMQSDEIEIVFSEHRKLRKQEQFNKKKPKLFFFAILIFIVISFFLYFVSDFSKIKGITVNGNYLFTEQDIMDLTKINHDDIWLFLRQSQLNKLCEENPLIESITLEKNVDHTVNLIVKEKKMIGYRYLDIPELISSAGECIPLKENQNHLISRLPLIVGFNQTLTEEEQIAGEPSLIEKLAKAMSSVDSIRIEMIAEIHQFAYSYDQNGILCIMQDGNKVYGSMYSMEMLNSYNQVASALVKKQNCIYIDEMSGNPYVSLCPEEIEALEAMKEKEENDKKADE